MRRFGGRSWVLAAWLVAACDGGAGGDDTSDTGDDTSDTDTGDTGDTSDTDTSDTDTSDTDTAQPDCTSGDTRTGTTPCGLNGDGFLQQSCAGGQWADTTTCIDTDVCVDTTVEVVGTCGLFGASSRACADGQWGAPTCDDPATVEFLGDLVPGAEASFLSGHGWVATGSGLVLFVGNSAAEGLEVWRTDGTPEGTFLVADLAPGAGDGVSGGFAVVGDTAFFATTAAASGGAELWKTDGTPEGTVQVADLHPTGNASPSNLTVVDGLVFFSAWDGASPHRTLWSTDGTDAGTVEVSATPVDPIRFAALDGVLYFVADDADGDGRLWRSDGTDAGTVEVVAADASVRPLNPLQPTAAAGLLWFSASTEPTDGHARDLWVSDGTSGGTDPLHDDWGDPVPELAGVVDLDGYQAGLLTINGQFWVSDGTPVYTFRPFNSGPVSDLVAVGEVAYMRYVTGDALVAWVPHAPSNLSTIGSVEAVEAPLVAHDGALYVATQDEELFRVEVATPTKVLDLPQNRLAPRFSLGSRLILTPSVYATNAPTTCYVLEGTTLTVLEPDEVGASSFPDDAAAVGDVIVFTAYAADTGDAELLHATDGATAWPVKAFTTGGDAIDGFGVLGDAAYFVVLGGLWRTDGTEDGTTLVKADLGLGTGSVDGWATAGDRLWFTTDPTGNAADRRLWQTDGTTDGTVLVRRDEGGTPALADVGDLRPAGDGLYARGDRADGTATVWYVDGSDGLARSDTTCSRTPTGLAGGATGAWFARSDEGGRPVRVDGATCTDLYATGTASGFTALGAGAVFVADDPNDDDGLEPWFSGGTAGTTLRVADIEPGVASSDPASFTTVGATAFFAATRAAEGRELWATDGTSGNTALVRDVRPGATGSSPANLLSAHGKLWFTADDGAHGRELWVSQGTADTTRLVADLAPGARGSDPGGLVAVRDRVLFFADDGVRGREPWVTDGTDAGTLRVADIGPGARGSSPAVLAVGPQAVLLRATDRSGAEPWAIAFAE